MVEADGPRVGTWELPLRKYHACDAGCCQNFLPRVDLATTNLMVGSPVGGDRRKISTVVKVV